MAGPEQVRRRDVSRQREAGAASRAETRRRLVVAAGALFVEVGYERATVAAIARRAGVSVQTLYLAGQGKRQLLQAWIAGELSGADTGIGERYRADLRAELVRAGGDVDDPVALLRGVAHVFRVVAGRAADAWRVSREAAAVEPEIAADRDVLDRGRRTSLEHLLAGLPADALRPGLDAGTALDTVWVLASPETYDLMVRRAGHTLDDFEAWLADTLVAALLRSA